MYNQPKRIEYLDSIRGIAALFVLFYHSMAFAWPKGLMKVIHLPVVNLPFDGAAAVAMFFVLSGFVLSRPYLLPASPRQIFLPTFYLRRFTRIWIPWFFVFCLSAVVARYFFLDYETTPAFYWAELRHSWHFPLTLSAALRQMALMNLTLPENAPFFLPQDWSLGIELKASLLIPLFVFCARGKRVASLLVVAVLMMLVSSHGYYVSFVLGVALARGCDQIGTKVSAFPRSAQWLIFAVGILLCQSNYVAMDLLQLPKAVGSYFWCLNSVGCVLVLVIILSHPGLQSILQHRSLVFLGRISYSIYLLHILVLVCVQPLMIYSLNAMGITQTVVLLPVSLGVNLFITITLAALAHRVVEVPAINLGHWLTKKIQARFQK